ncbi:MAG: MogA/MoaB family molybdenum cofactor biosynthesis protein [Anaerolineaceae bacterium]|nr:MogA/MoaB family molybdenum cofactor biosynthesis protein [Anaerolineaceae bacterium]
MIKTAVLTISDRSSQGLRADLSGPALVERVTEMGGQVVFTQILPDDLSLIRETLLKLVEIDSVDLILTTGGTGFSPRDITPEATLSVLERNAPGLAELMRAESLKTNIHASLSRGVSGIRKNTLIVNLPGNPKAAVENFNFISAVLPHALSLLQSDPDAEAGHLIHSGG